MTPSRSEVAETAEVFADNQRGETRLGYVPRLTGAPALVEYEIVDGMAIFEGDIVLGPAAALEQTATATAAPGLEAIAITGDKFRWRNGVVPFRIDANLPDQTRVTNAIAHWEQNTPIRFVARTAAHDDFVTFRPGSACSSEVGRQGGEQSVNLGPGCTQGSTIHEIGHAVGLWHEQSREDRGQHITIHWDNIEAGKEHNFNQHVNDGDDIGAYDYGSIMHYPAFAFAKDPTKPTITAPQPIGQRNGLSAGDIAAIRSLYYFRRQGDSGDQAGEISEVALARHSTQQIVTAVRTETGTLKLISWRVNNDGSVTRTGDSADAAGEASHIVIAKSRDYVTACRAGNGKLKLISWGVNNAGAIARRGDSGDAAGEATLCRIVALTDTLLVTACRSGSGSLFLISWRLNANGSITRLSDSGNAAGACTEIAMASLSASRLATAVRAADGTLKVIVWDVGGGGAITRRADTGGQAGEARMIRMVVDTHGHLITSVRAANGDLKLISWAAAAGGGSISRLADSGSAAGEIGDNALMARSPGVVSAVRAKDGHLKLIAWNVSANGSFHRAGDSYNLAGEASAIALCPESLAGVAPIVSACRTSNGRLRLIGWDD